MDRAWNTFLEDRLRPFMNYWSVCCGDKCKRLNVDIYTSGVLRGKEMGYRGRKGSRVPENGRTALRCAASRASWPHRWAQQGGGGRSSTMLRAARGRRSAGGSSCHWSWLCLVGKSAASMLPGKQVKLKVQVTFDLSHSAIFSTSWQLSSVSNRVRKQRKTLGTYGR